MKERDHSVLLAELSDEYARYAPRSAALDEKARSYLVDGGNHAVRLNEPFPPRIRAAKGAWVQDEDGHNILDFWQGHFANILGHNPELVAAALARAYDEGFGLQTGFADCLQVEVAEMLCDRTGAERVRLTTSGSLATMYAVLLARAYTGRELVLKVGGGWHGAQPWALKGVSFDADRGYACLESEGLPPGFADQVICVRFNDTQALNDVFRRLGDELACFIIEPFVGSGGFIPASREYLQDARDWTYRYGTMLIFDEVISGFRFHAGDVGALYGIQPDLATFGKIIGGGMPVAAVAGRDALLRQASREHRKAVRFQGGTYSAHPASMLAAKTMLTYLVTHEAEVYPRLAELGAKTRRTVEAAFAAEGIHARCTGGGNEAIPGSSMGQTHFPYAEGAELSAPEDVNDPARCDVVSREKVVRLALLLENITVMHGLGAVSMAHTEADIAFLGEACRRVARRIQPTL